MQYLGHRYDLNSIYCLSESPRALCSLPAGSPRQEACECLTLTSLCLFPGAPELGFEDPQETLARLGLRQLDTGPIAKYTAFGLLL